MSLVNLKSNLSEYNPVKNNDREAITLGNNKLIEVKTNKSPISLADRMSDYSPGVPKQGKQDTNQQIPTNYDQLNKKWVVEKEIYEYNSILRVDNPTKVDNTKVTKQKAITLIKPDKKSDVTYINSKLDIDVIKYANEIKEKKSDVKIEKVQYDINDYKSDIILNDIKNTTVLNKSVMSKDYDYRKALIDLEKQSPTINRIDNSNKTKFKSPEIKDNKKDTIDLQTKYTKLKFKLDDIANQDISNDRQFNSKYDDIKTDFSVNSRKLEFSDIPKLKLYANTPIDKLSKVKIINTSNIQGRFTKSDLKLNTVRIITLETMDTLFNDIIKKGVPNLTEVKNTKSDLNIDTLSGVDYFLNQYQNNFSLFTKALSSDFNFKQTSKVGLDKIKSIGNFKINVLPFVTEYKIENSVLSNINNNSVNYITDANSSGFTLNENRTLYKFDSTELRWKGKDTPNVNYFDVSNIYANQFVLRQSKSEYRTDVSRLVWKGNDINSVNYLDVDINYQRGIVLRPEFLNSNYKKDASNLVWKGNDINSVNYLDTTDYYQKGFNLRTPLLQTYYNKDISQFDYDGASTDGPVTNYFDVFKKNTVQGFRKLTPHFETDYIKDSTRFDWDGESADAPVTDYFDRTKRNTIKGFRKFTPHFDSDYIKDSTRFDWDGESANAPSVNYLDVRNFHQTGLINFPLFKVTNYNQDTSDFVWKGSNIPNVNYLDLQHKNTEKGFELKPSLYDTDYINDTSQFVWKGSNILAMNFFDDKHQINFYLRQRLLDTLYNQDTSELVWKGSKIPSVNYFNNTNQVNFTLKQGLLQTLYNNDTSNLVWKGDAVNTNNYFDTQFNNSTGFTRAMKDSELKPFSSLYKVKDDFGVDYFSGNISGFDVKFTDVSKTKFTAGDSRYDDLDKLRFNPSTKYSIGVNGNQLTNYSQFETENYLSLFRRPSTDFVSNYSKEDSRLGVNNIPDITPGAVGFTTKKVNNKTEYINSETFKITSKLGTLPGAKYEFNEFWKAGDKLNTTEWIDNKQAETTYKYEGLEHYFYNGKSTMEFEKKAKKGSYVDLYGKLKPREESYNPDLIWSQPFVVRGPGSDAQGPERYGWVGSTFDDGFIRGGILTYANRVLDDVQRMSKWHSSGKGLLYIARQVLLQKTNPNVETYPTDEPLSGIAQFLFERPTQLYNPLNSVLASKGIIGPLTPRHSLDSFGGNKELRGEYETIVRKRNELSGELTELSSLSDPTLLSPGGKENRLLLLTKELFPNYLKDGFQTEEVPAYGSQINTLSGKFGPNSKFALGSTNFKRYVTTYDRDRLQYHRNTYDKQYSTVLNLSPSMTKDKDLQVRGREELDDMTNLIKDLEKYQNDTVLYTVGSGSNQVVINPFNTINGTMGKKLHLGDDPSNPLGDYVAMKYSDLQLVAKELRENRNKHSITQGGFSTLKKIDPPSFESEYGDRLDFIAGLFEDDQEGKSEYLPTTSMGSQGSYSTGRFTRKNRYGFKFPKNIVESIAAVDKKGKVKKDKNGKTITSHQRGKQIDVGEYNKQILDSKGNKINLIDVIVNQPVSKIDSVAKIYSDANGQPIKDYVKLIFSSANWNPAKGAPKSNSSTIIVFPATLDKISDSFKPDWDSSDVMGRGEKVYMYGGFSRDLSFSFKIVITSLEEHYTVWRKLNELATFTAPDFGAKGGNRMMGPIMRLTIGDMYLGVPGFLSSLNYDFDLSSNFEIAGYDTNGDDVGEKKGVMQLPGIIDVSVGYTVIGNYRAERGGKLYELKNEHGWSWHPKGSDTKYQPPEVDGDEKLSIKTTEDEEVASDGNPTK